MSFFAESRIRPRLAYDGVMGQEPPLKRLRTLLGVDPSLGDVGYGVGTALGFVGTGADPFSLSAAYGRAFSDASMLGSLRAGLDEQMLAAPAMSGALGSLGLSSSAAAFIERHLSQLDPHQVIPHMNLGVLQGHPLAGIQLPGFTLPMRSRSKTKLCKHFIEGNCKFNENCSFAHSIEELKKLPGDGDLESKTLLEKYRAKADAEKQPMGLGQDAAASTCMGELKTKLCKHFVEGECRFKEGCHFAHSIEELKKLPEEGDDTGKALLEMYKSKAMVLNPAADGQPVQMPSVIEPPVSTIAKTKLCRHFLSGNCKYKESCNFAHSIEELKNLPSEGDVEGKALLEQYRSRKGVEKPSSGPELVQALEITKSGALAKAGAEDTSSDAQQIQKSVQEWSGNTSAEVKVDDKSVRLLKTKMCKHFLVGACKFNEICTFAHSIEELKPPADTNDPATKTTPTASMTSSSKKTSTGVASTDQASLPAQSAQQLDGKQTEVSVKGAQTKDDKQGIQKTKPCRFFSDGTCRFGHACSFLHGKEPMHGTNSNGGPSQSGVLQGPADIKPTYKTRLCNMWEKDKTCTFGSKCHFAHGQEELRQRAGPSISGAPNLIYGALEMEAFSRARQIGFPTSLPYSYEITDTNWRPFRTGEEAWSGLGGGLSAMNERSMDAGASETMHLRALLQNYGQLDQASSLASLSSLGGANRGLTFANMPAWQTR